MPKSNVFGNAADLIESFIIFYCKGRIIFLLIFFFKNWLL